MRNTTLVDGLEWNIRLSAKDVSQVVQELIVTFQRLWEDSRYELFNIERDAEKLHLALKSQRHESSEVGFFADLRPFSHQQEALEELTYARLEGKNRNLVIAATGTGKTLLAAFDYQRQAKEIGGRPNLLFVAHRGDILKQSLGAFRAVMRDSDFGELNVGLERAGAWRHVFASIQSLKAGKLAAISPSHFDVVIIDEFHHAEAPTYTQLLDHFVPRQLIGLTATPERTDGRNVIERFGTPTYELRLWHALDRQLLCPFHYFGIDDATDLSAIDWRGGRYIDSDLERQYVDHGNDRANLIIRELFEKVSDVERMRVVAFCATIRHADFMASQFRRVGLPAEAMHSGLSEERRNEILRDFRTGVLSVVCTVDLFNEGIDIPEINTVLFLRPTESATVFIQQLGRGLRNHAEKGALTVLDFVGQQNRRFRMDLRFRAMTGLSRVDLDKAVKSEFPTLPPGCHIRLDRKTQERVLKNVREAIPSNTKALVEELRRMSSANLPVDLSTFIQQTGIELSELYKTGRSFTSLKKAAGIATEIASEAHRVGAFIHVDDVRRIACYKDALTQSNFDTRFEQMMSFTLNDSMSLASLSPGSRGEMLELLSVLETVAHYRPSVAPDLTFALHGNYTRDEIAAVFVNPKSMRQGTFRVKELELDIHMITLRKSEREFSPTTRYADYFIAENLLHWESQSTTTVSSTTGQRLTKGLGRHLFFVREERDQNGRTSPFLCLGFASPVSHESEKPIKLVWKLEHPVPDHTYVRFRAAAG